MTDPRTPAAVLHRAAQALRAATRDTARGPWRWSEPDTEIRDGLPGRPTSPKYLSVTEPGPVRRFAHPSLTTDRAGQLDEPAFPEPHPPAAGHLEIAATVAEPLADLLDALGEGLSAAPDAGASMHEEPYRSALATATAVLETVAAARPAGSDAPGGR